MLKIAIFLAKGYSCFQKNTIFVAYINNVRDMASDDGVDYEMLRAMREERDAYDDFIASLDMND